ncbi:MAG TPA: glycerol-3-phosphate 1-O-acyltransferase PlsY [Kiritimatiellia bacterium]|nr:glycerol-3-phosphate 1-O-acyltransferase PlsY [Kiritimatiellia bacterium]
MNYALLAFASYLLGAIPFGLLLGKLKGIDVRTVGSKNIGATNVLRSVGKPWGIATFVLDALKGFLPALVFPGAANALGAEFQTLELARLVGGAAAILGHNFPVYLGFKGGKGVATSAGALLGIAPWAVAVGLAVWALFFFTLRYVSLASIVAALSVPVVAWWQYRDAGLATPIALTILAVLIILRHRANIRRLLNGTEHRFERK